MADIQLFKALLVIHFYFVTCIKILLLHSRVNLPSASTFDTNRRKTCNARYFFHSCSFYSMYILGETFENGDGLCLMLYIISCLLCATDRPFIYCGIGTNDETAKCLPCFGYQQRALRIIQIKELDKCIFPLLSFLQNTVQMLKMRLNFELLNHSLNLSC